MADRLGGRSPTWLSGLEYDVACLGQHLREVANLGAFPAAFDPLQGDEPAASLLPVYVHRAEVLAG
jgi:hypothetical protein